MTLHYIEEGAGRPLVLGHGLYLDGTLFEETAAFLAGRGWRVMRVDLRCHGASRKLHHGFTLDDMTDDVARLIDDLDLGEYACGGLSMGGMLAMRLALRHGPRLRALVLMNTSAEQDPQREMFAHWAAGFRRRAVTHEDIDGFLSLATAPAYRQARPPSEQRMRARMLGNDPQAIYHATMAVLERPSILEEIAAIEAPTLVVVGEQDRLTPLPCAAAIQRAIPRSELFTVPESGHLSVLERPELVHERLARFLAQAWPAS